MSTLKPEARVPFLHVSISESGEGLSCQPFVEHQKEEVLVTNKNVPW